MKISIIIPSYNSSITINYTLHALVNQIHEFDTEILIVDSSDDGLTDDVIKTYLSDNIRMIKSGIKVMPARQRNIGAAEASGELLIFLDSDVIPCNDFIKQISDAYTMGHMAGCGSLSLAPFQVNNSIVVAQYYLQLNEYLPSGKPRIKAFPAGASVFCSKEIFKKTGGYPEVRAAEDVLLGLEINKIAELWFLPDAVSAHIFRENLNGFYSNQRMLGQYAALYRREMNKMFTFPAFLMYFLYPLLIAIKLYRILPRILIAGKKHFFSLVKVFPYFLAGLHHWTLGFISGSSEKVSL